ncbi:MAG: high frequency lysogenization protein HflD [Xanthomonadales bacterium]|nr:high frequency lysogenization protein HflD [Xanthomonadales bacterium]
MKDRTMALSGLFQATELVRQAATHGTWSGYAATTCLSSLLKVEAESVTDIFGSRDRLQVGTETLVSVLEGEARHIESLRYAVGLLQIERKFRRQGKLQHQVGEQLEQIATDYDHGETEASSEQAAERVAALYAESISPIKPRIVVNGKPQYLQLERNVNWIRTLLFAGLRSAVLWNQLGGSRWNLMFGRKQMLKDARDLLRG